MPERGIRSIGVALLVSLAIPATASAQKLVTAPGLGAPPSVRVIDATGTDRSFLAYDPAFVGGVRVALGDVNGDGVLDIITGAGPGGGPHVRVWDGATLTEIGGFFAYHPAFAGGVFVAAGDVNGDGRADIITGAGAGGGPHVASATARPSREIGGFFAYDPAFPGGVTRGRRRRQRRRPRRHRHRRGARRRTARARVERRDAHRDRRLLRLQPGFTGGVNVAAGDVDGDGLADIVTGAGRDGGGPHVRVWSGADFRPDRRLLRLRPRAPTAACGSA